MLGSWADQPLQVARGGHHDDVGNAVEDQRHGDFLGDAVDGGGSDARLVADDGALDEAGAFNTDFF